MTGAGYVREVGAAVTAASPGDPVLLSFSCCGKCHSCAAEHPSYCVKFNEINFGATPDFQTTKITKEGESKTNGETITNGDHKKDIHGGFFGQSSFANVAIVHEASVVNVKGLIEDDEDLKMLAPLGCGVQTGTGTVVTVAGATSSDTVTVMGLGGVGLTAIMAAKMRNCKTIIGIDRVESRMALAKRLGATHVINTSDLANSEEVVDKVFAMTEGQGSMITIDTTGHVPLISQAVRFTGNRGRIYQIGIAAPGSKLEIPVWEFMAAGKQYIGTVEGDSVPADYVPQMIRWYKDGLLPMNEIVKFFKAEDFETAVKEMAEGKIVKPVIVW